MNEEEKSRFVRLFERKSFRVVRVAAPVSISLLIPLIFLFNYYFNRNPTDINSERPENNVYLSIWFAENVVGGHSPITQVIFFIFYVAAGCVGSFLLFMHLSALFEKIKEDKIRAGFKVISYFILIILLSSFLSIPLIMLRGVLLY